MSHDGYVVRRAADADVFALGALRRAWVEEMDGPVLDESFEGRFAAWYDVEATHRLTWLAQSGGLPVGMLNLSVFTRMPKPGRSTQQWAYVSNVFVHAEHRDGGVGRLLLDAAIDESRSRGFVRLVLNPTERAVPFYERAGFRPSQLLQLDL